jgi:hypothetical protein
LRSDTGNVTIAISVISIVCNIQVKVKLKVKVKVKVKLKLKVKVKLRQPVYSSITCPNVSRRLRHPDFKMIGT